VNTPLIVFSHVDCNYITFPKLFYTHKPYTCYDFSMFSVHSELYLRSDVPVVASSISSLEFYRDWVATNLPVLIKGAVNNWPAIKKWNLPFLRYSTERSSSSMHRVD